MKADLHIVQLMDDPRDAALIQSTLEADGIACGMTCVRDRDDFMAVLDRGGVDLIVSDSMLPALVKARWPDLPVIVISRTIGEELAIDLRKSGATDYFLKEHLFRLAPAVRRAMREVEDRTERGRLEAYILETQEMERIMAHDFNNILMVIMGNNDLIKSDAGLESSLLTYAQEIGEATQRAVGLTRRLQAFGCKPGVSSGRAQSAEPIP